MNAGLLNRLALETGGAHYPEVIKQYQEDYTKKVLMECKAIACPARTSNCLGELKPMRVPVPAQGIKT